MLVYFECFIAVQKGHACLQRIFQCRRVYLHFTYNNIYTFATNLCISDIYLTKNLQSPDNEVF